MAIILSGEKGQMMQPMLGEATAWCQRGARSDVSALSFAKIPIKATISNLPSAMLQSGRVMFNRNLTVLRLLSCQSALDADHPENEVLISTP
ncbi:hypothetical protein CWO89_12990 [Bradyrhizobium sp. Leo170]|nr:hypothetical protein CWO89_12990 [Bradyrhizobium sp. Leo170]